MDEYHSHVLLVNMSRPYTIELKKLKTRLADLGNSFNLSIWYNFVAHNSPKVIHLCENWDLKLPET